MNEVIDLNDICPSPHRLAYESFFQFKPLKNNGSYDKNTGLYKLISTIFPISYTTTESVASSVLIYPITILSKQKPTEDQIKQSVENVFHSGLKYFAHSDIKFPGSKTKLVKAGSEIKAETLKKIVTHNTKSLKNDKIKPLKKIKVISPQNDGEAQIIEKLLKETGFEPKKLERKRKLEIRLSGYSLKLPVDESAFDTEEASLEALNNKEIFCRRTGNSLLMAVKLELGFKEESLLLYKSKSFSTETRNFTRKAQLGAFPVFTQRDTFVIKGVERVPVCQILPRNGLHITLAEKEYESENPGFCAFIRPESGPYFKIILERPQDVDSAIQGTVVAGYTQCALEHFLKDIKVCGKVNELLEKAHLTMPESPPDAVHLDDYQAKIFNSQFFKGNQGYFLGEYGRRDINKRLSQIFKLLNCDAPQKKHLVPLDIAAIIIYLHQLLKEPNPHLDDRMDLASQRAWLISDKLETYLKKSATLIKDYILYSLETGKDAKSIPLNFSKIIEKNTNPLFYGEFCQVNDDTNPLSEVTLKRKLTLLGPGGIGNTHGLMKYRGVHHSHYSRICLSETPESEKIGFNLTMALAAKIDDGQIKAPFANINGNKSTVWLSPEEEQSKAILPCLHDKYPESEELVMARQNGKVVMIKPSEAALSDKYCGQFLGLGASLIPFVQHNDNNRVMMGAKNMKQALPLLKPEIPLIQTGREKVVARLSNRGIFAETGGTVTSVTSKAIAVETENGDIKNYRLEPIGPTSAGTVKWHRPLVKKGDRIQESTCLADGACMRDGNLSLGVNLLVAYMPYYGLNFEDGMVVSDRLVKENILTSVHVRVCPFDIYGNERMTSKDNSHEMFVFKIQKGILCREGQRVRKGDPLFIKYCIDDKKKEWFLSPVNGTIIEILKEPVKPKTIDPSKVRYRMIVHIIEQCPIAVGDKLMGRHGNKGIVSRILPSAHMPFLKDGTPVDIILNPHGVISRMNLGQILETHWGWVVKNGGDKYSKFKVITPFEKTGENELQQAFEDLAHTGIDSHGKAFLIDGLSGQKIIEPVVVGYQYFIKLDHLVEEKLNIRETGHYTLLNRQPVKGRKNKGGQRIGEMEGWALQAHLAYTLLQEFLSVKSDAINLRREDISKKYFNQASPLNQSLPFLETLKVTAMFLRSLCLEMTFHDADGNIIPLERAELSNLEKICIRFADFKTIEKWAEGRIVDNPHKAYIKRGKLKPPVKQTLFDPLIFQDKRNQMAFIPLVEPVIHPLLKKEVFRKIRSESKAKNPPEKLGQILKKNRMDTLTGALQFNGALVVEPESSDFKIFDRAGLTDFKDSSARFLAGAGLVEFLGEDMKTADFNQFLLDHIPVLPMDYRPYRIRHGKTEARSELNDFYREIIGTNKILERMLKSEKKDSEIKLFYQRAKLQRCLNRLMIGDKRTVENNQKPLVDRIKGKQGIFRMYQLGKRVDVSARAVIVPQPELALDEVGLPLVIAAGLLHSKLVDTLSEKCTGTSKEERKWRAKQIVENLDEPENRGLVQSILFNGNNGILKDAVVVLNRAPSLQKYNMLSFKPVCSFEKAIGLHPLVCGCFNADFDGDQMAVFLPLSTGAMEEAKTRMLPSRNLLSAANGKIMLHLTQDIAIGIYLMTSNQEGIEKFNGWFSESPLFETVSEAVTSDVLKKSMLLFHLGIKDNHKTAKLACKIMTEGFRQATLSGLTFSIFDVPAVSRPEPSPTLDAVEKELKKADFSQSPVAKMAHSGARGSVKQLLQLGGMRGHLTDIDHNPLELPVNRNFREGISPLEYYLGSHAGRRSMCEKKLLTAPAGDFTRLMIESAYHLVIKGEDCGCKEGLFIYPFPKIESTGFQKLPALGKRLTGRTLLDGTVIDEKQAKELESANKPVLVRTPLMCRGESLWGYGAICRRCYGWDLSTRCFPEIGLPVGIIAGESIGEQGTQLTMRTFHTGGVGGGMITEGLPRMKKLLGNTQISVPEYVVQKPGGTALDKDKSVDEWQLFLSVLNVFPHGRFPTVIPKEENKTQCVTHKNLGNILRDFDLQGILAIIAFEAQKIYKSAVDEKHFEIITRSMLSLDKNGSACLSGIRRIPLHQPGFLAAAGFQRAIQVLVKAALTESCDKINTNKTRLMVGKRIGKE